MARARSSRLSFAKIPEVQPLPGLLSVQHDSFSWFLDSGLSQIFGVPGFLRVPSYPDPSIR